MLSAFAKALAQFGDPAFRRPLLISLALAVLLFAALWAGVGFLLTRTALSEIGWLELTFDALGGLAAIVLTFILFPGVAGAILSLFADRIIAAVEARYYPGLPPPRAQSFVEQALLALRFLGIVVVLNVAVLPLYLIPFANILVFYGMNGYLLGREYFEMVAPRRLDAAERHELWRRRRPEFIFAGGAIAFVSTLPFVNFAAPALAAAAMTHLVETYRRSVPLAPGSA